jgi:hypothetical protein
MPASVFADTPIDSIRHCAHRGLEACVEGRAPWEFAALLAAAPWLRQLGDGHLVIVFPAWGFGFQHGADAQLPRDRATSRTRGARASTSARAMGRSRPVSSNRARCTTSTARRSA